jgi:hypothetical protein
LLRTETPCFGKDHIAENEGQIRDKKQALGPLWRSTAQHCRLEIEDLLVRNIRLLLEYIPIN